MMERYIAANKAIADINAAYGAFDSGDVRWGFDIAKGILDKQPTADVQEVRHGKWSRGVENSGSVYAHCSACNRKMNDYCYGYPHCPMCGAQMDGKE